MTTSVLDSVLPQLVCGCGPHHRKRPHLAVVWRAAALDAMPDLWKSAAAVLSADSCALRYEANRIVGLVPCEPVAWTVHLGGLVEAWHQRITADIGPVSGGRSSTHAGRAGLDQAVREALCALEVGDRAHGPGALTAYGDIFVLDYAARLVNDPRLGGLYDRVPSRLRTFDEAEQAELLPTLEAFLAEGSIHGTATQLSVHRNTVQYRLKRIEELTRIDLEDPETRFLVQLALRAHRQLATESA
jgi:sugar diacid utilization regulator